MSSNDHKKFKTEATQKTSTDTEVISDTVLLPPYSTDHVLTVTAPSSTAGLTGQVDVELEMSPDGENWCPAQTETITAGSGGTATGGVSAEDANLNAVSTLPDPNSATPTYTYTGNKFALGSKSYDDSGNELDINTPNDGTKDFMHQLMSKDKPFNYSLWLKTKTDTQTFADDYTPVIFRHGGKDKFTNLKTIELTDSGTQNLCSILSTDEAVMLNNQNTEPNLKVGSSVTHFNPFRLSTESSSDTMTNMNWDGGIGGAGVVVSTNMRVTSGNNVDPVGLSSTNVTRYRRQLMRIDVGTTSSNITGSIVWFLWRSTSSGFFMSVNYLDSNENIILYNDARVGGSYQIDQLANWFHISQYFVTRTDSHQHQYYSRTSYNGGSPEVGFGASNVGMADIFSGATIQNITFGGPYRVWDSALGANNFADAGGYWEADVEFNKLCFYTGFLNMNNNWQTIYNNRKNPTAFTSSNMTLKAVYDMVGPSDDTTNKIFKDIVEPSSGRQLILNSSNADVTISDISNEPFVYEQTVNQFESIFDTTKSSSISGWFKTTIGATGTLFSNTGGAAATGLKVDVSGSGITASYLSSSQTTFVSGNFNDGEWHHIVMALSPGSQLIVVDNTFSQASNHNTLVNDDLRGDNGFTLLGDGQSNANATSPSLTDASKLQAYLSNWSLHSEELNVAAISQLYSNGHVRNIKNLPAIDSNEIKAWWKLSDTTTPEEDSAGSNDLTYNEPVIEGANTSYISSPSSTATGVPYAVELVGEQSWFPSLNTGGANTMPGLHDDWTISFWWRPQFASATSTIWDLTCDLPNFAGAGFSLRQVSNGSRYIMARYPDPNSTSIPRATRWRQASINNLTNGVWYYTTIVKVAGFSSSSSAFPFQVYINGNGANIGIDTSNQNTANPPSTLFDNVAVGSSGLFKANHSLQRLGDIITFNRALTATEVNDLYANHNNPNQVTAIANNIDAHFRMGDGPDDILGTNYRVYDVTDTTPTTYLQNSDTTLYPSPLTSYATSDTPYESGTASSTIALSTYVSDADGATKIVEEDQYGSGITMSLTKRFNTTNNEWTNVHTNETCVCLSFNGFEDQAEHFAIYTHDTIDVADNAWHNLALSFSGREGGATTSTTNFSFDTTSHNFVLSIDGSPITGAHFVGGLAGIPTGKSFTAQERYLKWDNNSEEDYIPHAQLNSNIFESINQTNQLHEPVKDRDYKTGFVGYADESSFHSESWFTDSSFNPQVGFNDQKVKTLYGSTGTTLSNRGAGSSFPVGTPYPLRRPSVIGSSTSTGNQYIDPDRYNASTNADGGLEAWWRWGDTTGDCSININDAIGYESGSTDTRRSLKLNGTYNSEENSVTGLLEDLFPLTSSDSIYVPEAAASSGGGGISLVNVIIENVQAGVCNLKNLTSPILQYIRVKFTNSGEAQLGEGKLEATVHYRKRRER